MNRILLLLIISALNIGFCPKVYAQNVSGHNIEGRTCDEKDKEIEFATVMLISKKDTSKVFGAVSGSNGVFALKAPKGDYTLSASMMGYAELSQDITISKDIKLGNIVLKETSVEIGAVTVKPQLVTREADRFVVNVAGSAVAIGKNASEMLSIAPGVWVRDGISINGRGGTQVMINNRLLKESGEDLIAYLNTINAEDIQKIEVIPNAGADYDANMTGGIVKITLKRQRDDGMNGSLSMRFEYNPQWKNTWGGPSVNLNYKANKLSLYTNLNYNRHGQHIEGNERTDFISTSNFNETVASMHNTGNDYSARLGAIYDINIKQSIGIEVNAGAGNGVGDTKSQTKNVENGNITNVRGKYNEKNSSNRLGLSANYILNMDTVGSTFRLLLDYNRNNTSADHLYNSLYSGYFERDSTYLNDVQTQNSLFSTTANFDIILNPTTTIKTGGKYTYTNMDNDIVYDYLNSVSNEWNNIPALSSVNQYTENIGAVYFNYSTKVKKSIGINLGLRGEYTHVDPSTTSTIMTEKQSYFGLFPNANIMIPVNKKKSNMIILNYSRKISRPSFWHLNPFKIPVSEYSFIEGNPKLKPAYFNDISLAFVLAHKYTLTAGTQIIQGAIQQIGVVDEDDENIIIYRHENLKKQSNYYISLNIPAEITKWWRLNANLTGINLSNTTNGIFYRQNLFQGNMSNTFTILKDTFIDIDGYYMSSFLSGNMRIKSMYNVNASLKRNFAKGKFTASVFVNNIFNSDSHFRGTITGADFIRIADIRQSYNRIGVSFRYNFKKGKEIKVKNIESGANEEKSRL